MRFIRQMLERSCCRALVSTCAVSVISANAAAAEQVRPPAVRCALVSVSGCSAGICIADKVASDFYITYDFAAGHYRSSWGTGRITQMWNRTDGSHAILVASPPAGAQVVFSSDYKDATVQDGEGGRKQFSCKALKR